MMKSGTMLCAAVAVMAMAPAKVSAEVLDAVYRGTMVCAKLPFTKDRMREAIEVTVEGGKAKYTHVVRLRDTPEALVEKGEGTLTGQAVSLQGVWKDGSRQYEAKYSGTFVRRGARISGTQTWTDGGKTLTRACSGAVKRPLKAFLPKPKKT